jgi:integrase/recombinase XerC
VHEIANELLALVVNRMFRRPVPQLHGRGDLLSPTGSTSIGRPLPDRIQRLLDAWQNSLTEVTRRAYSADWAAFASWAGAPSATALVAALLQAGKLEAETLVLRYLAHLRGEDGLTPRLSTATIGRRRAAFRSLFRMAEGLGLIPWTLTAPLPRSERPRAYRDTRGPGLAAVRAMREAAAAQGGVKGLRDVALLGLLYSLGLRRAETCSCDVVSFDQDGPRLAVVGKGHADAEWLTVPEETANELQAYLAAGEARVAGPLFLSLDRAHKGTGRLTPSGLFTVVRALAAAAGVEQPVSPHQIRHSAITGALDGVKGDVRRVRRFSRHAKVETVLTYDDQRKDEGGEIAAMNAAALGRPRRSTGAGGQHQ